MASANICKPNETLIMRTKCVPQRKGYAYMSLAVLLYLGAVLFRVLSPQSTTNDIIYTVFLSIAIVSIGLVFADNIPLIIGVILTYAADLIAIWMSFTNDDIVVLSLRIVGIVLAIGGIVLRMLKSGGKAAKKRK